jgi:hypothetical protein
MLKQLLIIVAIVVIAFEIAYFYKIEPAYSLLQNTVFPFVTGLVAQAQSFIGSSPFAPYLGTIGVSSVATAVAYLVKRQANKKVEQAQQTQISQAHDAQINEQNLLSNLDALTKQKEALQTQVATLTSQQGSTATLQAKVATLEKQVELAQAQRMEAERLLRVVQNPTIEDLVRTLNRQGYQVSKVVE